MQSLLKKSAAFLLFLFLVSTTAFADNNDKLAADAKREYDKANYKEAAANYEKIIASGLTSSKLYFNAANAYYKSRQTGKAIYYYELPHKLDPADEDIKHNLTIANKLTRDQVEQKENYFAKNIEAGILHLFSTTGWAWMSIITLTIACLCFAFFRLSSRQNIRRALFWLGVIALVKCLASMIIGSMALNNIEKKTQAIILAQEVKVLNAPTADAKSQFNLHEGTKVHVLETNVQWTSISLDNGNEGWVATKDIGLF